MTYKKVKKKSVAGKKTGMRKKMESAKTLQQILKYTQRFTGK